MLSVDEAQERLLATIAALDVVEVPILEALNGVLARDAFADIDLPPFTNSAMDGYAILAADSTGASPDQPRRLPVAGEIAAGDPGTLPLAAGTAVRIMTGAPLPPGADAVIPVEQTHSAAGWVDLLAEVVAAVNVRPAGEDVRRGQRVLQAGAVLRPGELGLLASIGYGRVPVYRRPTVAILSTGDELVEIGQTPGPGQIRNSNATMLAAQVVQAGGLPRLLGVARDTSTAVHAALDAGRGADLLISSGGVSVGDYDVVRRVVAERGALDFWRVAMRPGKPVAFGHVDAVPFLGLPGNPVSSFVTFELFARPVLRKMAGHRALFRRPVAALVEDRVPGGHGRRHYVRAYVRWQQDGWHATTTGAQGSHLLRSTVAANGLIVVSEDSAGIESGSRADVLLLDWPEQAANT
jgi:molybdopterin molybdotransferase